MPFLIAQAPDATDSPSVQPPALVAPAPSSAPAPVSSPPAPVYSPPAPVSSPPAPVFPQNQPIPVYAQPGAAGSAIAQPAVPWDAIGLSVSWVSGSGLAYRHWFDNGFGFQLAGVPYMSGDVAFLNVGGQAMYRLVDRYPFLFYALGGAGYAYNKNTFLSGPERADMGIAPGIGLDYALNRNLWASAHIGYTFGAQVTGGQMTGDFKPGGGISAFFAF